jgi:hypothetical protein
MVVLPVQYLERALQAVRHLQQAMTLASDLGMRPLLVQCALGLGALDRHMGRRAPAEAALATARTLFAAMEMTSGETHAKTLLNQPF